MKTVGLLFVVMFAGLALLLLAAGYRWNGATEATRLLLVQGLQTPASTVDLSALDSLPAPVQRYLREVLKQGQPMIQQVRLTEEGTFLTRPENDGWGRFTATHDIVPVPAGFVWDARISMGPGITVRVRDSFVNGAGSMFGSVHGMFRVMSMENTPEMAEASLQRYLAEAVWVPTSLLPVSGVQWTALDSASARATLTSASTRATLDFHFDPATGLVSRVFAEARGRAVGGSVVPTPWQGRWSEWSMRNGMKIPSAGEVEWLLPEGPQPYYRGRLASYSVLAVGDKDFK
ncbi:MAG: hypothetical protein H7066_19075 [Cytophagaceae bacterium]|nr:hypothetical protein [Gemmatimonadaceae bacterium]